LKTTIRLLLFFAVMTVTTSCRSNNPNLCNMSDSVFVIKKMTLNHCARGPQLCEKCKEMAKDPKYCLLKLYTETDGKVARPVVEVYFGRMKKFCEYDVVKVFSSKDEALFYSKENNTPLINNSGR
jgi:hypothetical protein